MSTSETALKRRIRLLEKKLAEEAQLQQEFFTNFNHELRTPLNTILGFSQLAQADDRLPAELRPDLDAIITNARYLLDLVEQILQH